MPDLSRLKRGEPITIRIARPCPLCEGSVEDWPVSNAMRLCAIHGTNVARLFERRGVHVAVTVGGVRT